MPDPQEVQQPAAPAQDNQAAATPTATPDTSAPQMNQPVASPSAAPAAPAGTPAAAPTAQSIGDKSKHVLGEIFQTIAGGQKVVYKQGPNGPEKTYQDLKPGEMARGILAAAITGLASGYDPANRGHGPAMSSAFAGGFKGEQEQRDKQAGQQEKEAQQTFANQNASEEMILKKHADARAQTESMARMGRDTAETNLIVQQTAQGKETYTDARAQRVLDQINQRSADEASGYRALQRDGKDIDFTDGAAAMAAAHADPKYLLHPGDYDTKVEFNPVTSRYTAMLKPRDYDTKEVLRFAKMEKDGVTPVLVNGKPVSDGTPGPDGRAMPPTPMSGKRYNEWVFDNGKAKLQNMDYKHLQAETNILVQKQMDDKETKSANNNYFRAGGKLFAVDASTGIPYIPEGQREVLINQAKTLQQLYGKQVNDGVVALSKATTDAERESISNDIKEAKDKKAIYDNVLAQGQHVDKPTSLADSLIEANTGKDGAVDVAAAQKQLKDNSGKYSVAGYTSNDIAKAGQQIIDKAAAQTQAKSASAAQKSGVDAFTQDQKAKGEKQVADDLSQSAEAWQGPAAPKQVPIGRNMGMNPNYTEAEAYIAANPNLSPDDRAAIRNKFDIQNGRVSAPADPALQKAIQALQGHDRNDIRQFIANQGNMTNEQKVALYNYFYLTPPSTK